MKMLRAWYKIHRDWTLACGAYNSGRPIQNEYALYAGSNKNYKNRYNQITFIRLEFVLTDWDAGDD